MACVRRQGNLKQIMKLNHPVIVQLENESLALLISTKENQLGILNQNNEISWASKSWLDKQWLGTYFIIWPMPAQLLLEPSVKDLSNWALEMANTIANDKISVSQLRVWIKNFQKENGLLADGIIGKETQMALALAAYNGPTLTN